MTLRDFIISYRKEHDMSQRSFAQMCGVSNGYISMLEKNRNPNTNQPIMPTLANLQKIAAGVGMTLNELFAAVDDLPVSLEDGTDEPGKGDNAGVPLEEVPIEAIPGAFPVNPVHRIPLLGQIAAGLPIYAEENLEGFIWTDRNHGGEYFSLRVRGDSMNAANINDGDIVIVRRQDEVEEGEIAVVLVDEEATIKRYRQDGKMVILSPQSTNPEHHTQVYSLKDTQIKILGRVVESRTEY